MIVIDSTKPTIDPSQSPPFASSMPDRDDHDILRTGLSWSASNAAIAGRSVRDAPKRDGRQMLPFGAMLDAQFEHDTGQSPSDVCGAATSRESPVTTS